MWMVCKCMNCDAVCQQMAMACSVPCIRARDLRCWLWMCTRPGISATDVATAACTAPNLQSAVQYCTVWSTVYGILEVLADSDCADCSLHGLAPPLPTTKYHDKGAERGRGSLTRHTGPRSRAPQRCT